MFSDPWKQYLPSCTEVRSHGIPDDGLVLAMTLLDNCLYLLRTTSQLEVRLHVAQRSQHPLSTIDVIHVFYVFLFRSRFYVFNVFFLNFFHVFYVKKTSNAKIQRKILLDDALAKIIY